MPNCCWIIFFVALSFFVGVLNASIGDSSPFYKSCVDQCEKTGCIRSRCFQPCKIFYGNVSVDGPWYIQKPLYLQWKRLDCQSDCRYHCMLDIETKRETLGIGPVKYHGKWPFQRVFGLQEPIAVVLSVFNLATHFHGWLSFFILLYHKLPLRPRGGKTYYEYAGLWHVYALLQMNAWFWSALFHTRSSTVSFSSDVDLTEKLDYSSAVAVLGCTLILSMLRIFSVRDEAARVMVAAPLIAFVTTHILYLNFYKFDYGLNMKVCVLMGATQLLMWAVWAYLTHHPSRWKLWVIVVASGLAMLLEIYDFPPYKGFVDAHALWHAATIPLSFLWWSFLKDDAQFRTMSLLNKAK